MTTSPDSLDDHWVVRWGATHIHTTHSDGGVSVADTIDSARRAGLDFVHVTDHNTIGAREDEGYHDDLLLVVDVEVSPSNFRDHVLAIGLEDYPDLHDLRDPGEIVAAIRELGGTVWVPHPRGFRNLWCGFWNAPWSHWDAGVDGVEIGSFCVDWTEALRPWTIRRALREPLRHAGLPLRHSSRQTGARLRVRRLGKTGTCCGSQPRPGHHVQCPFHGSGRGEGHGPGELH